MKIKMIAADIDGTFLDDQSNYNRQRFLNVYEKMKEAGIHFVVASGNTHQKCIKVFGEEKNELTYIAENGAQIIENNEVILQESIADSDVLAVIEAIEQHPDVLCWVCSTKGSYALDTMPQSYFDEFLPCFPGVQKISDFRKIEEPILKFALYLPNGNVEERIESFESVVNEDVCVIDSGHDCVDIIHKDANKGHALEFLMKRYGIEKEEVMSFGNAMNDALMLEKSGYGYAMENSKEELLKLAKYIAPSNNEDGVFQVIEQYFESKLN